MAQALQFSSDATFVIVVFAIALLILVGVVSYIFFRGRNRHAANDTVITFNNNHRKPRLILLVNDDSPPAGPPRYPGFYHARNSLIDSESKSFSSINISPSRSIVFGHEMGSDSEGFIRVVLTPPTPAKRERRKSLIYYEPESEEDLPAYS